MSESEYEFDSDLDRDMDEYFVKYCDENRNKDGEEEFDSDIDRDMDEWFAENYPPMGAKRKALKTRSERNKRQRLEQTGTGLQPQLSFELLRNLPPEELTRFHRIVYKAQYKLRHNLASVDILEMGQAIDRLFKDFMQPPRSGCQ